MAGGHLRVAPVSDARRARGQWFNPTTQHSSTNRAGENPRTWLCSLSQTASAVGYEGRMLAEGDELELPEADGKRLVEAGVLEPPKASWRRSRNAKIQGKRLAAVDPGPESISRAEQRCGEVQEHLLSSLLIPPAPGLHRAGGTSSSQLRRTRRHCRDLPLFGLRDDARPPRRGSERRPASLDV